MSREQPPAGRLSARRIEREAVRILPGLATEGAYLRAAGESGESRRSYRVIASQDGVQRATAVLSGELADAFRRRGWLEEEGETLRLSDMGRAWLCRRTAETDPFLQQHQERVETTREVAGTHQPVVVNETESPLGWLRRRKDKNGAPLISDAQFQAGERLRSDFWRAQMTPRVTANWGSSAPSRRLRRGPPSHSGMAETALAAKQHVLRALAAVGPELSGVLIDVCCHLRGLADAEQSQGWPQRSGKVILQIALTRLARHYGLISDAEVAAPVRQRLRHWGTEDYKPHLQAWR